MKKYISGRFVSIYFLTLLLIISSLLLSILIYNNFSRSQINPEYVFNQVLKIQKGGYDFSEYLKGIPENDTQILDFIRNGHIFPPSKQPYNLTKKISEFVNHGQTEIILKILKNKKNGFFIEAGALDGELSSTTLPLEVNNGWTGLLIEPQPDAFKTLLNKHRKAHCIDLCLSTTNSPNQIEFLKAKGAADVTRKGSMSDLSPAERPNFQSIKFQCFPIGSILAAMNVTEIDYFSLDLEGSENEVLSNFPFDSVLVKTWSIEKFWRMEREALKIFMFNKGFDFVAEVHYDFIFAHQSLNYHQYQFIGRIEHKKSRKCVDSLSQSVEFDLSLSTCRDAYYRPLKNSFMNTFYLTKEGVIRYFEGGCWSLDANRNIVKVARCWDDNFMEFDKWTQEPNTNKLIHATSGKCLSVSKESKIVLGECHDEASDWNFIPK